MISRVIRIRKGIQKMDSVRGKVRRTNRTIARLQYFRTLLELNKLLPQPIPKAQGDVFNILRRKPFRQCARCGCTVCGCEDELVVHGLKQMCAHRAAPLGHSYRCFTVLNFTLNNLNENETSDSLLDAILVSLSRRRLDTLRNDMCPKSPSRYLMPCLLSANQTP